MLRAEREALLHEEESFTDKADHLREVRDLFLFLLCHALTH